MDVAAFLDRFVGRIFTAGNWSTSRCCPSGRGDLPSRRGRCPPALRELLAARGIERLYSAPGRGAGAGPRGPRPGRRHRHGQRQDALLQPADPGNGARPIPTPGRLYLFPTKALAQDQLKGCWNCSRGDAGSGRADSPRRVRRRHAHGPAAAHPGRGEPGALESRHAARLDPALPSEVGRFFSNLRYVVIDEVHTYRGILGAHVACVLRRLVRVCEHYGSRPVFLAASATIANPGELAGRLIGREVAVIDDDGSPRGPQVFRAVESRAARQRSRWPAAARPTTPCC